MFNYHTDIELKKAEEVMASEPKFETEGKEG